MVRAPSGFWAPGLEGPGLGTISLKSVAEPKWIFAFDKKKKKKKCDRGTPPSSEEQSQRLVRHGRMGVARGSSHILSSHAITSDGWTHRFTNS